MPVVGDAAIAEEVLHGVRGVDARADAAGLVAFDRVESAVGEVVDKADVALPAVGPVAPPDDEVTGKGSVGLK